MVGPNGAGKSTFVRYTLSPILGPGSAFVNADEIAAARWPDDAEAHAYDAANIAAKTRDALIRRRLPFIAETVFSHPSKLDLIDAAAEAGYRIFLHVLVVPEQVSVERVPRRVLAGGHRVPEAKIRARYQRLWPLVAQAAVRSDSADFYDNTDRTGPRRVAQLIEGAAVGVVAWPGWTPPPLPQVWPSTQPA